jgi:branched-chain amino acid transport system substrate-binding protein
MTMRKSMMLGAAASAILMVTSTASLAADVTFDLKYGVLAGLTGDPAPDGQAWNEAARLAIEQIQKSLDRLKLSGIKVELSDSQDSQGSPQPGVEGAQKLVNVDHVQVIVGLLFIGDERGRDIGDYSEQRSDLHWRH